MNTAEDTTTDDFLSGVTNDDQQQQAKPDDGVQSTPSETDKLSAAMADLAKTVQTIATPKEVAKEPTPQEINEFWGVFDPEASDKEFHRKFFRMNPDATPEELQQAKEIFAMTQKGLVRQAIIGAQRLQEKMKAEMDKEYGPLREYVQQQQARERRTKFETSYPALADERYNPVMLAVAESLKSKNFDSEDSYFKALAEGAAEHIRKIVPTFDLGAGKKPNKSAANTPKLPRTSVGGSGGSGGGALELLSGSGDMSSKLDW